MFWDPDCQNFVGRNRRTSTGRWRGRTEYVTTWQWTSWKTSSRPTLQVSQGTFQSQSFCLETLNRYSNTPTQKTISSRWVTCGRVWSLPGKKNETTPPSRICLILHLLIQTSGVFQLKGSTKNTFPIGYRSPSSGRSSSSRTIFIGTERTSTTRISLQDVWRRMQEVWL